MKINYYSMSDPILIAKNRYAIHVIKARTIGHILYNKVFIYELINKKWTKIDEIESTDLY